MLLKLGIQHRALECYQVCSNDDPWLTFDLFTARSELVAYAFVWEKGKTMDFSETIVVCDIRVGRCRQLNEYMNLCECQRSGWVIISPTKHSFRGYTVFSMCMIPWFCQHLRCLLYNFDSLCPILFKFTPHLNHQTVQVWQENRGWRVSITRVMPLCNSYNKMFVLSLIVILSTFKGFAL